MIPGQGTPHHIWDGVGCDRSTHHTNPQVFLPQRVEPESSRTGWCALPGSLPLKCHRFPMIRSPSQCPGTLRSSTSSGRSSMLTIPTIGWVRCPTRLTRPASGALRAQHDPVTGQFSFREGIEPWCRRPRGTQPLLRRSGSPCTVQDCHHKPLPGVSRRFGGVSWNASGPLAPGP